MSAHIDEARLAEIEARANAATPGPWRSGGFYGLGRVEDCDHAGWVLGGAFPIGRCAFCARAPEPCSATVMHRGEYDAAPRAYHAHWIATESDDGWHSISSTMAALAITGNYDYEQGGVCSTPEDSAFIAHARTDVPDLVAEVRRLTAALATVTTERDALLAVCERFAGDEGVICNGYEDDSGCGSCGANANHSDADPANHAPDCARLAARVLAAKIRALPLDAPGGGS